jgi:hypothetical protein
MYFVGAGLERRHLEEVVGILVAAVASIALDEPSEGPISAGSRGFGARAG